MAENNKASNSDERTTQEVLKALGQVVYAQSKHLESIVEKVTSIEKGITEDLPKKLDELKEALSGLRVAGPAQPRPPAPPAGEGRQPQQPDSPAPGADQAGKIVESLEKGFERLSTLDEKLGKIESVVTETGDSVGKRLDATSDKLSEISELASSIVKVLGGEKAAEGKPMMDVVRESTSELAQSLQKGLEHLEALKDETGSLSKLLTEATSATSGEIQKLAESFAGSVDALKESLSDLSQTAGSILAKSDAVEKDLPELRTSLEAVISEIKTGAESMSVSLEKLNEEQKTLLDEKSALVAEKLDTIPGSLGEVGSTVSSEIETLRKSTEDHLQEVSKAVDLNADQIKHVGRSVEDASETQRERLEQMSELLLVHKEAVTRSEVEELNRKAIGHFSNGEYGKAIEVLEKAMSMEGERPELLTNLGHIHAAMGDLEKSEESFRKALRLDPELQPTLSALGTLLVEAGRADETLEFLRRFVEDETPSIPVMISYSRALVSEGRHSDALELIKKAREIEPHNPEVEKEYAKYSENA
ncbi:tetratricopeptide repeat protein [Candidatus Fermentibacteria bacterium]|nr:tetratricopeptide repeat protein [Candidatus Fermentibacteria bacterium]